MSETNGVVVADADLFAGFDAVGYRPGMSSISLEISGILAYTPAEMRTAVEACIASGKRPSASLRQALERMTLHAMHLENALCDVVNIYRKMVSDAPRPRVSTIEKTRRAMLEVMPPKVLKEFAKHYIDVSDYILPDDTAVVINAVLTAMAWPVVVEEEGVSVA